MYVWDPMFFLFHIQLFLSKHLTNSLVLNTSLDCDFETVNYTRSQHLI